MPPRGGTWLKVEPNLCRRTSKETKSYNIPPAVACDAKVQNPKKFSRFRIERSPRPDPSLRSKALRQRKECTLCRVFGINNNSWFATHQNTTAISKRVMESGKRAIGPQVRLPGLFISELISNADYYAIGRANRDIVSGHYTQWPTTRWYVLFFYKNLIGLDWVGLEDGETCSWARP